MVFSRLLDNDGPMHQVLTFPVHRSIVVAGLLLGLSLAYGHFTRSHRLILHAVDQPSCVYLTAWRRGEVRVDVEPGDLAPLGSAPRAGLGDVSKGLGRERLEPIGPRTYAYRYDEV